MKALFQCITWSLEPGLVLSSTKFRQFMAALETLPPYCLTMYLILPSATPKHLQHQQAQFSEGLHCRNSKSNIVSEARLHLSATPPRLAMQPSAAKTAASATPRHRTTTRPHPQPRALPRMACTSRSSSKAAGAATGAAGRSLMGPVKLRRVS